MAKKNLDDKRALDLIRSIMSGKEWNADTTSDIAGVVRRTGRTIRDTDEE